MRGCCLMHYAFAAMIAFAAVVDFLYNGSQWF